MIRQINENLTDEEIRQAIIRLMAEGIIQNDKFDRDKFIEKYGLKRAE